MKLLLENWREYIKEGAEGSSPLDLKIGPNQRILDLSQMEFGMAVVMLG